MTRSTLTRSVACAIACAGLSIFTRGAAAQIMSAPATPNATSGTALTDWNISYRMPANWRVGQTIGRLQMIVSNTDAGMIFLAPGMYATPQDAIADLSTFYQQMQMQAYPVEQPAMGTIAGLRSSGRSERAGECGPNIWGSSIARTIRCAGVQGSSHSCSRRTWIWGDSIRCVAGARAVRRAAALGLLPLRLSSIHLRLAAADRAPVLVFRHRHTAFDANSHARGGRWGVR